MGERPTVLFETEGSYPYNGGGVSTWAHILCSELQGKVDFTLLALTGNPFVEPRYQLPENIRDIIHIPLWGAEEPVQYYDRDVPFSEHVQRKARTTNRVVKELYFPLFRDFIARLLDPFQPVREYGEILYGFWKYYQHYDYKITLTNPLLWTEFKHQLLGMVEEQEELRGMEEPRVFDVTFGMRWLYHFMMPLAMPIPDVSLTHSTLAGFPTLSSIAAKFEYGIPILLTDHGVFIRERLINIGQSEYPFFSKKLLVNLSTFVTRAIYHYADVVAPVTSVNVKWEERYEAASERIEPIYNGVDPENFKPTGKPSHTAGRPTVVAAAQVFPLKDIETMIRCCDVVRREIPEVQFILYGSLEVDKAYVERCRKLVKELKLQKHFKFGGFHNTPSMIFNEGDLSILSSISEGFPYTVIESMSCARPVVATDVGGIREALEGCGILCRPRDPQALGNGVIELLKDDDKRIEMGRKARERVLLKYTIPQSVERYHEVYSRLHRKQRRPLKDDVQLPSVVNLLEKLPEHA